MNPSRHRGTDPFTRPSPKSLAWLLPAIRNCRTWWISLRMPDRRGQGLSCFRAVVHWCQALIRRTAWAKRWLGLAPRQGRLWSLAMPSTAVSP